MCDIFFLWNGGSSALRINQQVEYTHSSLAFGDLFGLCQTKLFFPPIDIHTLQCPCRCLILEGERLFLWTQTTRQIYCKNYMDIQLYSLYVCIANNVRGFVVMRVSSPFLHSCSYTSCMRTKSYMLQVLRVLTRVSYELLCSDCRMALYRVLGFYNRLLLF